MDDHFISNILIDFSVALGLVLGGSMIGAVAAALTHHPPMLTMLELADRLKIWALVAALGGSMDVIRVIGDGMWAGRILAVIQQFSYLTSAFIGCQFGYYLIRWLVLRE